ncbi:MAG: PhzF family phenazine biosynthesis protein [Thermomicrobiales bacterium]
MTDLPFFLADAFTQRPFAGNAAGVVTTADELSPAQMQAIARELGQTETCFVSETSEFGTDLALRWFTPTVEVDLCGHATVAAFLCLDAEGRITWTDEAAHVRCATRTGAIEVWLERCADAAPLVVMSVGAPVVESAAEDRLAAAAAIGLPASALDPDLPLAVERAGARLIVPVARLHDLLQLAPNGAGMIEYGLPLGFRRFTLVCRDSEHPGHAFHLRHFAPANGIPEDPVTGTAHAVAAVYLDWQGLLPDGERVALLGEQGHAVGRRGVVTVEVFRQAGRICEVHIGGSGVIVARGTMHTPELNDAKNVSC